MINSYTLKYFDYTKTLTADPSAGCFAPNFNLIEDAAQIRHRIKSKVDFIIEFIDYFIIPSSLI